MTSGGLAAATPAVGVRRLRVLLLALVIVVGGIAAAIAWQQGEDAELRSDDTVAQQAADIVAGTATRVQAGLAGASGMVPVSGPVDVRSFAAFAADVVAGSSSLGAVGLEAVVTDAERPAFEVALGRPIIDRGPDGPSPAPPRPRYYPVVDVVPETDVNRGLRGFDLEGDPVRSAAADRARDSGRVVFSEAVPSQPSGTMSVFVIKALYRPGQPIDTVEGRRAAHVGFVSGAYTGTSFIEALLPALPEGTEVVLRDGGAVVARMGLPGDGIERDVKMGDRTWLLLVDGPKSASHTGAVGLAVLTAGLALGLWYVFRTSDRHDEELRGSADLIARTAGLAQALAGAETVEEVEEVVHDELPALLGVRSTALAFVDRETSTIEVHYPTDLGVDPARRYGRLPLDGDLPLLEAIRTGRMVVVRSLADWRATATEEVAADVAAAGLGGAVFVPMAAPSGRVQAALAMSWTGPIAEDDRVMATVATVAEICQYALQRAMNTDDAARRATQLALLAEHLASAVTADEVAEVVTTLGRSPVEAAATSVGVIVGDVLEVHHGDTVPAEYKENIVHPTLDTELAVTEVARTGVPLLFETQEAYTARFASAGGPLVGARAVLPLRRGDGTTIGMIAHLWNGPRELDEAAISTLSTIAELTGQALERARLALAQAEDARHTEALAALAQGLTSRTNSDAVMGFLTRGVLAPLDAFHAAVGVIEGDVLRRHFTPGRLPAEVAEVLPVTSDLHDDTPLTKAARTGETILLSDEAGVRAAYPHLIDAWVAVGFGATANVPLKDRQGNMIGALGIAWEHPVTFDSDLRDRLSTVAGIAGQTLERTQLVDRLREDARRNEALAELAEQLASVRTAAEVAAVVAEHAGRVVAAGAANVALLDPASGRFRVHHPNRTGGWFRERFDELEADAAVPHVHATRDGTAKLFGDHAAFAAAYPNLASTNEQAGTQGSAVVPLRASDGHRIGAVGFMWPEPVDFDDALVAGIHAVSDLCGQALERAQLSDAEHRLVTTLQASVLAPLPRVDGLAHAARYLPAARSVGMGGDWYEGIELPDGRFMVVVGDVAGHGITAVGQMAQFRSVIGALARLEISIDELFALATSVVSGDSPIASAVLVAIDPVAGTLQYVAAGHPPPLLRLPHGEVEVLRGGRQPLLGVPSSPSPAGEHAFPVGATVLCYTDGLVERRAELIDVSVDRLATRFGAADTNDPDELADALLRGLVPGRTQPDDVALAVITRLPPT